jgi:hypothetical protein
MDFQILPLQIRPVYMIGLILFEPARCLRISTPRRSAAKPQPKPNRF